MSQPNPLFKLRFFSLIPFLRGIVSAIFWIGSMTITSAQIIPANDGTGTITNINGNTININGGTLSSDGQNLFHSFQQFGLNSQQIANFLSNPQIHNILSRVVGGDPSVINGLIQVTGGNSNLYLMNPSGFIFGSGASLNIPGSFTATTANGMQFGQNWFNAIGSNNYATLLGDPTGFAFAMDNPGIIINEGDLEVSTGQGLTLLGGTVINTGNIKAPAGNILISAVPGENFVRISMPGNLLSLEIEIEGLAQLETLPNDLNIPIASLPDLLTIGTSEDLKLNTANQVQLASTGTEIPTETGTAIISGSLDASGNTGGGIGIFGDTVGVLNADLNASGVNGGGNILIGGDFQGKGNVPNSQLTVVNQNSNINADANLTGNGGSVIIWSDQMTKFYGNISATGGSISGDGGFVEVSGKEHLIYDGLSDLTASHGNIGTLLLDPKNLTISTATTDDTQLNDNQILFGDSGNTDWTISNTKIVTQLNSGNVTLQANNDITVSNAINVSGNASHNLTLQAGRSININADISLNGNFTAIANDDNVPSSQKNNRDNGNASFIMNAGTNINTGNGNINISYGSGSGNNKESTDTMTIANLNAGNGNVILEATGISSEIENINIIGNINAGNLTVISSNNVLQSSNNIKINNTTNLNASNDITLNGNNNNFNTITATANNLTINDVNDLTLNKVILNNNLNVNADGNITQNDFLDIKGTSTFNTTKDIILNKPDNDFNIVRVTNGNNASLSDQNNIELANINISKDFNVNASNNIKVTGNINSSNINTSSTNLIQNISSNINVTSNSTFNASNNITLNGSFQSNGSDLTFNANAGTFTLNNTITSNNGNVIISSADVDLQSNALIDTSSGNITLQPSTITRTVGIGTNASGDFSLNNSELTNTINTSASLIIGINNSQRTVSINDRTSNNSDTLFLHKNNYNLTIIGGDIQLQDNLTLANNKTLNINTTGSITLANDVNEGIVIDNGTVNITANGSVGNSTIPLGTNVANLNINTANNNGNQYINQTGNLNNLNLNANSGNITLKTGGLIENGNITGNEANLTVNGTFGNTSAINTDVNNLTVNTSSSNGTQNIKQTGDLTNLNLNANTGNITFNSNGTVNINNGDVTANGASLNVNGNFGNDTNFIDTNVRNLTLNTANNNGNQNIHQTRTLNNLNLNANSGNITLKTGGLIENGNITGNEANLTVNGTFGNTSAINTDVNNLTVNTSSSNGTQNIKQTGDLTNLNLNANTGNITFNSNGTVNINNGDVIANGASLNVNGNFGNATNSINTNVSALTVNTSANNGNQNIHQTRSLNSLNLNAGTGNITLVTDSNINDSDRDIDLKANVANLTVNGNFGNDTDSIDTNVSNLTLNTASNNGNQNIHQKDSSLTNLNLNAGDGNISFKSNNNIDNGSISANVVSLDANNINLNTNINQLGVNGNNVTLNETNSITLNTSDIRGNLNLTASGNINQNGNLTVQNDANFTINTDNSDILLGNFANNFSGKINLMNATGINIRDIAIRNINPNTSTANLTFPNSNLRDLTIIFDEADITLPATNLSGNLTVTSGGNINQTQTGALNISNGMATFNTANNLTLDNINNDFNIVKIDKANQAKLQDSNNLTLDYINVSQLEITANGTINQNGVREINVKGDARFNTTLYSNHGSVTLNNNHSNGTFIKDSQIGGDFTINSSGNNVTLDNIIVAGTLDVNASNLYLINPNNVELSYKFNDDVFITKVGLINLSNQPLSLIPNNKVISGDLTVTSLASGQTFNGISYPDQAITLNGVNSFGGNIFINTSMPSLQTIPDANIPATVGITQDLGNNNQIIVQGTTNLNINGVVNTTTTLSGDLTLNNTDNKFHNTVNITGNVHNVNLSSQDQLDLSNLTISGNLTAHTTNGNITQKGAFNVSNGTTVLTATNNIILNNNNDFNVVEIKANNVSLNEVNNLTLDNSTINNNLTITAKGNLDQTGSLTVNNTSTFNTTEDLNLGNDNNFYLVKIEKAKNVNLKDVDNLTLGNSNITNNLTVNAVNIEQENDSNINVDNTANLTATNNITLNQNNNFNLVQVNANNVNLNDSNSLTLLASNINNDLTINTQGNGNIDQKGVINVANGITTLNANLGDITLNNSSNDFNYVNITKAQNVTLNETNNLRLQANNINGYLNITANQNLSTSGNINVNGSGNITLTSQDIEINNNITTKGNLTLQPSNSSSSIGINSTGDYNLNSTELSKLTDGFKQIIIGRTDSSSIINIGSNVTFTDPVTINTPLGTININTGLINISNGLEDTNRSSLTLEGNTNLNGDLATNTININTDSGTVKFNGTVNGDKNLTINTGLGDTIFQQNVGEVTPLNSLTINSNNTSINGNITTNNSQTFDTNVKLTNNVTLQSNNSDVTFKHKLNGNTTNNLNDENLIINVLNGTANFNDLIGSITPPGSMTVNGKTNINTNQITTGNQQTYNGTVTFNPDSNLSSNNNGNIQFISSLTGNNHNLNINTGGLTNFNGTVSNFNNIITDAPGTVKISANVTTTVTQEYRESQLNINNNVTLQGEELNLPASIIGNNNNLTLLPANPNQNINLGGVNNNTSAFDLTQGEMNFNGFKLVTIGYEKGNHQIALLGDVTIQDPLLIQAPAPFGSFISQIKGTNQNKENIYYNLTALNDATITIKVYQGITLGNINTQGGEINLTSLNDNITTGNLNSAGGDINLTASAVSKAGIATEKLTATDLEIGKVNIGNIISNGGDVTIQNFSLLSFGQLNTSSNIQGGKVFLGGLNNGSTNGDIIGDWINAQGSQGGNITVSTLLRFGLSDTFTASNGFLSSISTINGGKIKIIHGQDILEVGNFPIDDNGALTGSGVAGGITSGKTTLQNVNIAGDYIDGDVGVDTQKAPPNLEGITFANDRFVNNLPSSSVTSGLEGEALGDDFAALGLTAEKVSINDISNRLKQINSLPNINLKPAIIYAEFDNHNSPSVISDYDPLILTVITADGLILESQKIEGANRKTVMDAKNTLITLITSTRDYRSYPIETTHEYAQKLYNWLIKPIQDQLQSRNITNLTFIMDEGLRSLPVAALYDGEKYLVETYSVGLMPSFSLTNPDYKDISQDQILAMGATNFQNQKELPAVQTELDIIEEKFPHSPKAWRNDDFTVANFTQALESNTFGIIHLATHADFRKGSWTKSYIQFEDQQVTLDQLQQQLSRTKSSIELLVLSACNTAGDDPNAELGFAGFAVKAGVKSALASLWYVSDVGTLGLMSNFYTQLTQKDSIKAEALQKAQIAMLKGQTRIENDQIIIGSESFPLPVAYQEKNIDLTNPYYWSAFTLIGNPW